MKRLGKKLLVTLGTVIVLCIVIMIFLLVRVERKTDLINDDFSAVFDDDKYSKAIRINNITLIQQKVSCGYATIEMFSDWSGGDITEKTLYDNYGKVVTSTGTSFCKEMNKQFPQYETTMYSYLTNRELIDKVYDSLANGIPVPFEWAAEYGDTWTLHYSLIVGMDVENNKITVANPYGYYEELSFDEFLDRTRFDAYENIPFYLKLAFSLGLFEKNTVFIVK
ncbi:MAG: C39 family peptidase [Velocimicrobium sp.]